MIRALTLTFAAAFALPAITATDAAAHSTPGHQHIHQKGSRLVRIKIRKKRVGTGYVVVPTSGGTKNPTNGVGDDDPRGGTSTEHPLIAGTVDVTAAGATIASVPLEPVGSADLIAKGPTTARAGDPVVLTLLRYRLDDEGQPAGDRPVPLSVRIPQIGAENVTIIDESGWIFTARLTPAGTLRASVSHQNPAWRGAGVVSLDHQVDSPELLPLPIEDHRQKWTANVRFEAEPEGDLTVVTRFVDESGFDVVSGITTVDAVDAAPAQGITEYKIDDTARGRARLVAWSNAPEAADLHVMLVDRDTQTVVHEAHAEPVAAEAVFASPAVEFDPGDSPVGAPYLTLLDFLDAAGNPIGAQREVELVFPASDGEYAAQAVDFDGGWVAAINDGGIYRFEVFADAEDVRTAQGVNLIFEEPFEGPAPLETEVNAPLGERWTKWKTVAGAALPDLNGVTLTLVDGEGREIAVTGSTQTGPSKAMLTRCGEGRRASRCAE